MTDVNLLGTGKTLLSSFLVAEKESQFTKSARYTALFYSLAIMGSSTSTSVVSTSGGGWKPVLAAVVLHVVLWIVMRGNIEGPSNIYSFLDGVMLARGHYLYATPVAILNVAEAPSLGLNSNLAHGLDTALGFFAEKLGAF
jgi:hypothetical protein